MAPPSEVIEPPAEVIPEVVVPEEEEYELELKADSPLSEADLNEIATEASRLNLSKEDAEKLIASKESAYKTGASNVESKYQEKLQTHYNEMSTHPEFSGEAAAESWKFLNKAIAGFGDTELVALLNTPEVGNLVPLAKFLKKVGMAMAPDASPPEGKGTATSPSTNAESEALARQYPAFFK